MHVLFLHHNFPAQFGQIAVHLAKHHGFRCTFVSEQPDRGVPEIEQIQYQLRRGATAQTHYCTRTFENQIARSSEVYETLRRRPDIQPDLLVAHSGFVSPLFLRELYPDTPQISYFEYFYHTRNSDIDFRADLPLPPLQDLLRARTRNAALLLDLNNCDAGYSPTQFQRAQLPPEYQTKVRVIFDGIDVDFWRRRAAPPRTIGAVAIPPGHKVLTYVSRGFESIRGFDIFLQVADQVCRRRSDVSVVVVGEDRIAYGGDARFLGGKTFKQWAIERHRPNLERIHFVGRVPASQLVDILSLSDAHLYLTAPFVLSWSLLNAMACGCRVVASDTAPVRELVKHGENGWLADFFNVSEFVELTLAALESPADEISGNARRSIEQSYSLPRCLQLMLDLYQHVAARRSGHYD